MNNRSRPLSALQALNADCPREEWVRIGMAAKAAGLQLDDFHDWSALASNYAGESDCRAVWKSIDEDGGIGAGTLFAMALEQGWQDPRRYLQAATGTGTARHVGAPRKSPVMPILKAARVTAVDVWNRCEPATTAHPYLVEKGGMAEGLRIYPHSAAPLIIRGQNVAGFLAVPCWDSGTLQTLQFIPGAGDKLNLPGASFGAGYFVVGDIVAGGRIDIVEGLGQAWACHAAMDAAAAVCFGAGRMATVAAALRAQDPTARLVLVPDRGKENQAQAIAAAVNGAWVEMPTDKHGNYDAHDYACEHGVDALSDLLVRTKTPPMRFKLLSGIDLSSAPPMRWMVRGVLPLEGIAALYGPSGSGKSFLVLDIAASVACGDYEWFGHRVTQCPVTYCALEGEAGMSKRVKAWSAHHKKAVPHSLRFMTQPLDLLAGGDVIDLARAIQSAGGAGGLVILDTLNRAAPGADENSSVDMGNIIAAAKRLQDLTGGLVLVVHHSGKDVSKGLRGHSSLYAALDAAIEVSKADSRREWIVAKSKDDETGSVHAFKLEVVTVGLDDEGEEISSCVAVADDSMNAVKRVKLPQGGNQKIALDTLGRPLRDSKAFNKDGAPPGHPCIPLDEAVQLVAERLTCEAKRRTERARDAITGLVAKGICGVKGDWLWRT